MVSKSQFFRLNRLAVLLGLAILFVCGFIYWQQPGNLIQRLEDTLLDARLQARAERFAPSSEVVVVAFDQGSKEYFEKNPELGVTGSILPRDKLADVINILSHKGANSIVLDVELKAASENGLADQKLSKALRDAGNVFVASYTDNDFKSFIEQDIHGFYEPLYQNATFLSAYIQPYLNRSVQSCRFFPVYCASYFLALNSQPVYAFENFTLRLPENLINTWEAVSAINFAANNGSGLRLIIPKKLLDSRSTPMQEAYARLCFEDRYQQLYNRRPKILERLTQQKRNLTFDFPPSFENEQQFSYCRMSPVVESIVLDVKEIGISTVNYEENAFLSSVPFFYKGYEGQYFYYLPLLPVFKQWQNPAMRVTKNGIDILSKKHIDFFNDYQVLINWRNPKLLAKKIYQDLNLSIQDTDLKVYQSINSRHPNQILGYGHLYRIVSVSDLLKLKYKNADKSALRTFTPTLYNIYGKPESGELSFKNKIFIYGDAVKDIHITPVGDVIYGPEILANVTDMMLNDENFVHPVPWFLAFGVTLVLTVLMTYPLIAWQRLWLGLFISLGSFALFWASNFLIFSNSGLFFPLVWPSTLGLTALFATMFYKYSIGNQEKRQLTAVFSKYVSPQVLQEILNDSDQALNNLKGKKKELSVLFVDIHNFTAKFENSDPERMVMQLNEYFDVMTNIVLAHNATCDKYIGDALMAFFGAPVDNLDHAKSACQAAIAMQKGLDELNATWEINGLPTLRHGIGIASGEMFVGNMGSEKLKNFTVMGAVVNLGARLEAMTRQLKVPVLINSRTKELVEDSQEFSCEDMGHIEVKGFSHAVQTYTLKLVNDSPIAQDL